MARGDLPTVVEGDALARLPEVLDQLDNGTAVVVLTTWAVAYFSVDQRRAFTDLLADASTSRPVAWLSADGAGTVEGLAGPP